MVCTLVTDRMVRSTTKKFTWHTNLKGNIMSAPKLETGRYSVEELRSLCAIKDATVFATVTKTMTDVEVNALNTVRNAEQAAKTLEAIKSSFVENYDAKTAADFIASLPEFAENFCSLARAAVVKDGRGGSVKHNEKHGRVSFNDNGTARVSMIHFPLPDGSSLGIVVTRETNDALTVAASK